MVGTDAATGAKCLASVQVYGGTDEMKLTLVTRFRRRDLLGRQSSQRGATAGGLNWSRCSLRSHKLSDRRIVFQSTWSTVFSDSVYVTDRLSHRGVARRRKASLLTYRITLGGVMQRRARDGSPCRTPRAAPWSSPRPSSFRCPACATTS